MSIPLSPRTLELIEALFPEPTLRAKYGQVLETDVSDNLPYCANCSPEEMERLRFAVLKLTWENHRNLPGALRQAQFDWRDLLMAAGFGYDANEHLRWYSARLTRPGD